MSSQPRLRPPSRPIARITCPACGLEQPILMDCAGCRRAFSLDELRAARETAPVETVPVETAPTLGTPAPPPPASEEPAGQVYGGEVSSDNAEIFGDVYDPETAVHTRTSAPMMTLRSMPSPGDLVQESIEASLANFLPVAIVTAFVSIPAWLYTLYFYKTAESGLGPELDWKTLLLHFIGMLLVGFLCQLMGSAALTHVIGCWLRNQTVILADSLGIAFKSLGILVMLVVVQSIGVGIGYLFVIVPGIILSIAWSVAVPAVVVERLGAMEALGRSWQLTDGNRMTIFLAFAIMGLISRGLQFGVGLVVPEQISVMVDLTLGTILTAFQAVLVALVYFRLRTVEEGLPIHELR